MPVDLYIGGKEHATLHMYYARFITHFLHSIGVSPVKEPFQRLLVQGMVKGQSYRYYKALQIYYEMRKSTFCPINSYVYYLTMQNECTSATLCNYSMRQTIKTINNFQ